MKIVQANIWGGKLGTQITNFLAAERPDFVCMQEVTDFQGSGANIIDPLERIVDKSGIPNTFMSPTYSFRFMERELDFGNAILSQHPFVSQETVFIHGEYMQNFDVTRDDYNIRNLQVASFTIAGKNLTILNHHGYHEKGDSKQGNDITLAHMRQIAEIIDTPEGPVIVCGDFNLAPDASSLAVLNERLQNLSIKNHLTNTYNQFSEIQAVCDYIFVNEQVKVTSFTMSDSLISDHNALILEFEL